MADDPRDIAFGQGVPPDERYDANAELARTYHPLQSALIPRADLMPVINMIRDGLEDEQMLKARGGAQIIPFPGRDRPEPSTGMRSVYLDDLQIFAMGEYFEKASPVGFEGLRSMVEGTPVLNAVVMTRIRQMSRFCQPSEDGGPGFEIRHVDRKHKLTGPEQKAATELARFFQNCGWEFNPTRRKMLKRDNFRQLMSKLVRDSLTMDAQPIEREMKRDKSKGIDGIYAVDGSTVRLCTEEGYQGDDSIYALQVVQGRIATAYNHEQLIYEVRNPRADVRLGGYGLGETELLIRVVTGFLNAMTYNNDAFDKNSIPKGMLQLIGEYSAEDLSSFKRMWNMTVKGVSNAWALPVIVNKDPAGKAIFEKFGVDFNEMAFSKWMTFLVSIICSVYGMAPDEINFESFSAQKSSLSGDDTTQKLANAKDSGLRPDMSFWEATLTDFVVTDFHPDFCFRWVGIEEEDETQAWEGKKLVLSVDELRSEMGYEAWKVKNTEGPDMGQAPLNPSLLGPWMQAQQAEQQPDYGSPDMGHNGGPPMGDDATPGKPTDAKQPPGQEQTGGAPGPAGGDEDGGDYGDSEPAGDFGKALDASTIFHIGGDEE